MVPPYLNKEKENSRADPRYFTVDFGEVKTAITECKEKYLSWCHLPICLVVKHFKNVMVLVTNQIKTLDRWVIYNQYNAWIGNLHWNFWMTVASCKSLELAWECKSPLVDHKCNFTAVDTRTTGVPSREKNPAATYWLMCHQHSSLQ